MKRPDQTFTVTVSPVFYVTPCEARRAKEAQGFFGFHDSHRCPNCQIKPHGYEMWGENGHMQMRAGDRDLMCYWVGRKAREQWRMRDGGIMGYRFRKGAPIYYLG